MGQPRWDDTRLGREHSHVVLSHRQREWLVTVPDDVVVEILDQLHADGTVTICLWGNNHDGDEQALPWEGRLDQPLVSLKDPEEALDDLPDTHERD